MTTDKARASKGKCPRVTCFCAPLKRYLESMQKTNVTNDCAEPPRMRNHCKVLEPKTNKRVETTTAGHMAPTKRANATK